MKVVDDGKRRQTPAFQQQRELRDALFAALRERPTYRNALARLRSSWKRASQGCKDNRLFFELAALAPHDATNPLRIYVDELHHIVVRDLRLLEPEGDGEPAAWACNYLHCAVEPASGKGESSADVPHLAPPPRPVMAWTEHARLELTVSPLESSALLFGDDGALADQAAFRAEAGYGDAEWQRLSRAVHAMLDTHLKRMRGSYESNNATLDHFEFRNPSRRRQEHMEEGACQISRKRKDAEAPVDKDVFVEEVESIPTLSDRDDEIGSLARELARGHDDLIDQFQRYAGMAAAEATEAAHTPRDHALGLVRTQSPEQLSWSTLSQAVKYDPTITVAAWERIKNAARQELSSGHRTALSLERAGTPWDRARFLALRDAFRNDWQPRGEVESALIDLLAQSFGAYLHWSERHNLYVDSQCETEDVKLKQDGYWMPPRVSEAQWVTWCAEQANAAHRRFVMTLKSLQDLRRLPSVSIASVGQVNVAQQQVNVSSREDGRGSRECGFTEIM